MSIHRLLAINDSAIGHATSALATAVDTCVRLAILLFFTLLTDALLPYTSCLTLITHAS